MDRSLPLALATVLLAACGQPLELPSQVVDAAGETALERLEEPCPTWCTLEPGLRVKTTVAGDVIAYEVVQQSADWSMVLGEAKAKWGSPSSMFKVGPPESGPIDTAWFEARDTLHREHLGRAHELLGRGDPRETTRVAVWRQANTLVQVADDGVDLRATWVNVDLLD